MRRRRMVINSNQIDDGNDDEGYGRMDEWQRRVKKKEIKEGVINHLALARLKWGLTVEAEQWHLYF